jgi:hypothetical protein
VRSAIAIDSQRRPTRPGTDHQTERKTLKLIGSTRSFAAAVVAVVIPLAIAATAQTAGATDITNPAQHPYPITVTIDGQTYHDGEDTLPGYDDYSCTAIPDVVYDFADNEILYYDDQGDLLATAPWTEWSRISSYQTWLKQQSGSGGSGSSGSGSGSSGSSGSGSSGSGSSGSGSGSSASSGSSAKQARTRVNKLAGSIAKAPTSKSTGKYRVTISTPSGKSVATGKVTVKLRKGKKSKTVTGKLSHGTVIITVPKLAKGSWNVAISWPGSSIYLGDIAVGASIKVAK